MKASELRIGNYLNGRKGPVTVTEIRENNKVKIKENPSNFTFGDCLLPIPLTEEWLLNLGFKKVGTNFELDFFVFWYSSYQNCFVWRFMNINSNADPISLEYVHQLQNLYFALTGEELTLKS